MKLSVWSGLLAMEVKVRYLTREIAKSFGSAGKVETIHVSGDARYEDLLNIFKDKLSHNGKVDERMMDALVFICGGRPLLTIRDETLNSDCTVLVGYADTGG